MLDKATYLEAFHHAAAALAETASRDLSAPIASCPGWDMTVLIAHVASVYASRVTILEQRAQNNPVRGFDDLGLPMAYKGWFGAVFAGDVPDPRPAPPPGLLDLLKNSADRLEKAFGPYEMSDPLWTWWPPDQTAGFWLRRMVQETVIHRWDAEAAVAEGEGTPIPHAIAVDGIDEWVDVMLPRLRQQAQERDGSTQGAGETYHLHCTDGPGEWLVAFVPGPEGVVVTRGHHKGDAAFRGSASELLLFLWGRVPASRLDVVGDPAAVARYAALAPSM